MDFIQNDNDNAVFCKQTLWPAITKWAWSCNSYPLKLLLIQYRFLSWSININILFTNWQLYAHFVVEGHICINLQHQKQQEISHSTVINLLNMQNDVQAEQHLHLSKSNPCGLWHKQDVRVELWMQCTHGLLILVLLLKQQHVCTLHLHLYLRSHFHEISWCASC